MQRSEVPEVPEVDVDELARRRDRAVLIDVREDDEYAAGHIPGARHLPLASVPDRLDEIPTDRTVYVVCGGGSRSARAVEVMRNAGIDAVNVAGGTSAWRDAGHEVAMGSEPG
jgi:rhodanese-related sulfurtransferase